MMIQTNRRNFLRTSSLAIAALISQNLSAQPARKKVVILRSSWQTVNIGDIGHTPGVLTILEKHLPDVEIRLWPSSIGNGVKEILEQRFPKVRIVNTPELIKQAFAEGDFLLHGSGPFLVARADVKKWREETGKPYGIYGITFPGFYGAPTEAQVASLKTDTELLSNAAFTFFRDSPSLDYAKANGVKCPVMEFGPDGAFAVDLRNDKLADEFLKQNRLEAGKFLCVIPRQRYTPYWEVKSRNTPFDAFKDGKNKEMQEHDNAPLRQAIIAVLDKTDLKILICPEDETHVKLGKEAILDKLPGQYRSRVVWRDRYWLTDEALSTYLKSAGLFGLEMHSPIMCIGHGIPAIVCRFTEQTTKGFMWRDIGLNDWLFDMDKSEEVARIVPTVLAMAQNPAQARQKASNAKKVVEARQKATMEILGKALK
ncbi:polysaccharide pyruvyl transferase family protein [Dyadobacter aurulentus]|uniref:polysaccharide pyruvyl transferase family protein n=1 Tax=Dyadobacter sp. UC 10 TaxID=2605428 RepID=UPI001CEC58DF|nr:polysaccharide pyruvyl transferase family protein [Dyadobacter sp. UC 10]